MDQGDAGWYDTVMKSKIYGIVAQIPRGSVGTYGQIAKLAGVKSPRFIGYCLHHNPDPANIPCHRVVNSMGMVSSNYAFGGGSEQKAKLKKEGIVFTKERINLSIFLWNQKSL